MTKFNPTGSGLVYSTFLGGTDIDWGMGIAVDSLGNAYVTGTTYSRDFPTTSGGFQTTSGGGGNNYSNCWDAFVTKIKPDGSALVYSDYLGGTNDDWALTLLWTVRATHTSLAIPSRRTFRRSIPCSRPVVGRLAPSLPR